MQTRSVPGSRTDLPVEALPVNRLSNRAVFTNCAVRRRGYIAYVKAADVARAAPSELLEGQRARLENDWARGKLWAPLIVKAKVTERGWQIRAVKDAAVAVFLAERQPDRFIPIQVLEEQDVPATEENLELLKRGIYADQTHCEVLFARITY